MQKMFYFKRFILFINVLMIASDSQSSDVSEKIIIDEIKNESYKEEGNCSIFE